MKGRNPTASAMAASLVALVLLLATLLSARAGVARANGYYDPCGTLNFKGSHKLFHHVVSCGTATRKAQHVLKSHAAPRGWKCSLSNLSNGYAACARGQKAFALFPL